MNKFRSSLVVFVAALMVAPAVVRAADPTIPGVISGLTFVGKTATSVTLSWSPPSDTGSLTIDDYYIQSKPAGGVWTTFADGTSTSVSTTITGLSRGTSYTFRVAAYNSLGMGPYLEYQAAIVPAVLPAAPTNVQVVGQFSANVYSSTSRTITWTAPDDGGNPITDYVLEKSVDGSIWTGYVDGVSTATTATVIGLSRDSSYVFRVAAVTVDGQGPFGETRWWKDISFSSYKNFCGVDARGAVYCWGATGPSLVPFSQSVKSISSGNNFICAVLLDDTVRCKGSSNSYYQVTGVAGSIVANQEYEPLPAGTQVQKIDSGNYFSCALTMSSQIQCWGSYYTGSVGTGSRDVPVTGTYIDFSADGQRVTAQTSALSSNLKYWGYVNSTLRTSPAQVDATFYDKLSNDGPCVVQAGQPKCPVGVGFSSAGTTATLGAVFGNSTNLCGAINGELHCKGTNTYGQLGIGNAVNQTSLQRVAFPSVRSVVKTAGIETSNRVCGLVDGGQIYCWGQGGSGWWWSANDLSPVALPESSTKVISTVPVTPSGVYEIDHTETSSRIAWTAPIDDGGLPVSDYQIQYSSTAGTWTVFPDGVGALTTTIVTGLSRGVNYNFRVAAINSLGMGEYSVQSTGSVPAVVPRPVRNLQSTRVIVGYRSAELRLTWTTPDDGGLAISDYGIQYRLNGESTWIDYSDGVSLATAATVSGLIRNRSYDVRVRAQNSEGPGPWTYLGTEILEASGSSACVLSASMVTRCWGGNGSGQLGDGANVNLSEPTQTSFTTTKTMQVSLGAAHTCVLSNYVATFGGYVFCWGSNENGQLGTFSGASSNSPVLISGASGVQSVASGGNTSCAILMSGSVKCWGRNSSGQLGDGTTVDASSPVLVQGVSNATELSIGANHACARLASGSIQCWGANSAGQLGNGSTIDALTPVTVSGITSAVDIDAGGNHTCAVLIGGEVRCWGANTNGQLGNASTVQSSLAVQVSGISSGTSVALGASHSCALLANGEVKCWGANVSGQLGNGSTAQSSVPVSTGLYDAIGLTAGDLFSCATSANSEVRCWGAGGSGQMGNGSNSGSQSPTLVNQIAATSALVSVTSPSSPQSLIESSHSSNSVTLNWSAPIDDGGEPISDYRIEYLSTGGSWTVFADGVGASTSAVVTGLTRGTGYQFKVIALNTVNTGSIPLINATPYAVTSEIVPAVNPGAVQSLAISAVTATSVILVWSSPSDDGGRPITDYLIEYRVAGGAWGTFIDSISNATIVAVTSLAQGQAYEFRVSATSANGTGLPVQLSGTGIPATVADAPVVLNSQTVVSGTSVQVSWNAPFDGGREITDYEIQINTGLGWSTFVDGVSATTSATITGLTRGTVLRMRVRALNAIGAGSFSYVGQETFTQIAPGRHGCAIGSSGSVWCWGLNSSGEVGDGTTTNRYEMLKVPRITNASKVAMGADYTCALLASGEVMCWGANTNGQLGIGSTVSSKLPQKVLGISNAVDIDAGLAFACAVLGDGTAKCWGSNSYRQLGDGTTATQATSPVSVLNLTGVSKIATSQNTACALSNLSGNVLCWGRNDYGQGANAVFTSPTISPSLVKSSASVNISGIVGLDSDYGADGFCALSNTGAVFCWGANAVYQRGVGNTTVTAFVGTPITSGATKIAVGSGYSCALVAAGAVKCWGLNNYGQASGGSSRTNVASPTTVIVSGSTEVTAGESVACSQVSTSVFSCWGNNATYGLQVSDTSLTGGPYSVDLSRTALISRDAPASPTSLTTSQATQTSITVNWTAPTDNGGANLFDYVLEASVNAGPWVAVNDGVGTATSFVHAGLIRGASYLYRVSAVNEGDKFSSATTLGTAEYAATAPSAPSNLSSTGHNSTSVALAWSIPSDDGGRSISDFQIEYLPAGGSWTIFADGIGTATTATVTGLTKGTTYSFRISAVNAEGIGSASSVISQVAAVLPGVVTGISETGHTNMSVSLGWAAPSDNGGQSITDYVIEYKPSGGSWTRFNDAVSAITGVVVTGLTQGISYQFRVAAVTLEGEGVATLLTSSVIPRTTPALPTGLVETSHTGTSVSISWNAPSDNGGLAISDYVIEYKEVGTTNWVTFDDGVSVSTFATVSSLTQGLKYRFRVSAKSAEGTGSSSIQYSSPGSGEFNKEVSWGKVSCSVSSAGTVWCSGASQYGAALGNGFERVSIPGITNAVQVSVGADHTCALLAVGTVKCWGFNGWGELGNGTTVSSGTPVAVAGLTNVVQVESGQTYACARKSDGTIWCWGNGDVSRNGIGTTITSPSQLTSITSATDLALGDGMGCVVVSGNVKCWGYAANGRLGNPFSTVTGTAPQIVRVNATTNTSAYYLASITDVVSYANAGFTCARKSDGTVWCWGDSSVGQVGLSSGYSTYARQISGLSSISSVSIGNTHGCALSSGGSVSCWGWNAGGMIGDGTRTTQTSAVQVIGSGATWISAGHLNSAAFVNGKLFYWGDNDFGQQSRVISSDINDDILTPTDMTASTMGFSTPAVLSGEPVISSETHLATSVTLDLAVPTDSGGQPVTDYLVQFKLNSDSTWVTFSDGVSANTSLTVTGLTRGLLYDFKVAAITIEGTGAYSSVWSVVPSVVPGLVGSVGSPGHTSTSVDLSWGAPSDDGGRPVTDYIIEYQLGAGAWSIFSDGVSVGTSATITGLTRGSTYSFRVSAKNVNGSGAAVVSSSVIPATIPAGTAIISETHTATTVTLIWSAPSDNGGRVVNDYVIQYKLSSESTWLTFSDTVSTSLTSLVSGLTRGLSYDFRVAAVNAEGTGTFGAGYAAIPSVVPAVPTNISSPSHLSTSVDLTWIAPTDDGGRSLTDYIIEYRLGTGVWNIFADGVSVGTSATVTGLTRGSSYSFRVSAKNVNGAGVAVVSSSVIPATTPAAPVISSISAPVAGSSAIVNFAAFDNGGRTVDQMQYRLDSGFWTNPVAWSATSVSIDSLNNGQTYAIEIRATNADGYGAASNSFNVIPATIPGAPTVTAVERPVEGSKLSVVFGAADGRGRTVSTYQYSLNGSTWLDRTDGQSVASPLVISAGLVNGISYGVQIRAINAQGLGIASASISQVPAALPSAPTISRLEPSNGGLGVVFTPPTSNGGLAVSNYEYSLDDGQTWLARSPAAVTSPWIVTGLTNGTSYTVLLRAVNAQGGGTVSNSQSATPASLPSSPTITSVARPVAGSSLSVDFVPPSNNGGATIIKYQYSLNSGTTWLERTDSSDLTSSPMLIAGLVNGTSYQVTIRAANAQGSGVSSQVYSATPATTPSAPSSVYADTPVAGRSAKIYFTTAAANGDAITGYQYSTNNGANWITRSDGLTTESPISITDLTNGTSYPVRIRAINGQGPGTGSVSISVVPATVPDAPSILSLVVSEASFKVTLSPSGNGGAAITSFGYSIDGGVTWGIWSSSLGNSKVVSASEGVTYSVLVRATNRQGNSEISAPRTVRIGDPPDAQTTGAADVTSTSAQLAGRVTANYALTTAVVELSTVSDFSTDVKTIAGGLVSPSASANISVKAVDLREATTYFYRVVASNILGRTAGATISFETSAPVGVSLQDGAEFTNTPMVQVNLSWPRGAIAAMLSNDGGFKTYDRIALSKSASWKLNSTGNERLPKTVYVRYVLSDGSRSETYTDDIILDETNPTVGTVTAKRVAGKSVNAMSMFSAASLPSVKLSIATSDANSGLDHLEIKGGGKSISVPTNARAKSVAITITTTKVSVSVRSVDRAGNASKWKTVKLPK